MDPKVAVLKPLSSAIAIGTGGPYGAEGPIIVTGGAFGSLFAQAFHLSAVERKTLLVAGAAGGMTAIFATPVAAVLLAIELLRFEFKPRSFIPVACSAAVAGVLRVPLFGAGPLFPVTLHPTLPWTTLVISLGLGLAAGLGATAITALLYGCEDLFARLPIHWMWWPAIGGLFVGLGGLIAPRALGVGYDVIHDLLAGRLLGATLVALLLVKAGIWAIGLGSGTSGGLVAPLLLMGSALGALGATVFHAADPGLWATIGMAALMGGTMQIPITAIVFALELTGDVAALPALLIACVASEAVTLLVMRRSILTEKLARRTSPDARIRRQPAARAAGGGRDGAAARPPGGERRGHLPRRAAREGDVQAARARARRALGREPRRSHPSGRIRGALRHSRRVGPAHARRAHHRGRLARAAAPRPALTIPRPRRRLRAGTAILLEPAHHVELGAHEVGRLRSRAVELVVEAQHHRRHAAHLQGRVELLRLRDRGAAVQLTRHEQGRGGDVPDLHQRRMGEPLVRLVPERLMEEAVGEEGNVRLPRHADPVDHRAAHRGGGEPAGVADHPAREHAAPRASGDVHAGRIHVALADHRIHAGHEIVVVRTGIVVVDRVREGVAVASRAARVHVQHHVAVRREVLEHVAEPDVVHRERPAVDLEDQRVLLRRLERRRLDDPSLHAGAAGRVVPDLLDLGEPLIREHVVVHGGQARHGPGAPQVHVHGVARHPHANERARERDERYDLRALGDVAHPTGQVRVVHVDRAPVAGLEQDALAVGRPVELARIAVEALGHIAHAGAVDPRNPQVGRAVGVLGRIVARERDALAVRRHGGVRPITGPGNEGPDRAARDVEGVHARHLVLAIPRRVAQPVEHDGPAVRGPIVAGPVVQAVEPGAHVPVPARERARRPAFGRDEEEVREPLLHVPDAVLAVVQLVHHPRRGGPLRPFGRLGQRDAPHRRVRHEHDEGDRLAIGRPLGVGRLLEHAGHL